MSTELAPLYTSAIIYPLLAFPAWILCIPPLIWHFSQRNVAAGSLILWVILINFFNSVNPLIWPRDNLLEWWDGDVWCDINVRVQIGAHVGMAASIAMILRKLAKVMDTRNITVAPNRSSRMRAQIIEFAWCCGYPLVLVILYYIVQPVRYLIYAIEGCTSGYHGSWPSVVLGAMWGPITMLVAVYYAGLLLYRLFRYRQEFHRLLSARNTTKSRFLRLFTICIITLLFYVPYTSCGFWIFILDMPWEKYDWNDVHGPKFHTIVRVPSYGRLHLDRWGQVLTGFVIFFVFGTGTDAHNTYKKMLLSVGLGKIFPSLYLMQESGASTPTSFMAARSWTASCASKAKSVFSARTRSVGSFDASVCDGGMRSNPVVLHSVPYLRHASSEASILPREPVRLPTRTSFFGHVFARRGRQPILPLFSQRSTSKMPNPEGSVPVSQSFSARVWASEDSAPRLSSDLSGVHVLHEIHQDHQERERKSVDVWVVGKD